MNIQKLGRILQNEVNSAAVTFENHSNDNSFLDCGIRDFAAELENGYEPVGICKNVPFKPDYAEHSVAFCYKQDGELYWVHMTEILWFSLLSDIYGRKQADEIVSKIMNYETAE